MIYPTQNHAWCHKVGSRPVNHCFVANGDDLDDVRVPLSQCDSTLYFLCIGFRIFHAVIG